MADYVLQSYIIPVCLYEDADGEAHLQKAIGTAFCIGKMGFFLTARHVLEQAFQEARETKKKVGLNIKGQQGRSSDNYVIKLQQYEFAPYPYDIAVGFTEYHPETPIRLGQIDVGVWLDVATAGYPASSHVTTDDTALWINMRAHKGYVQRPTIPRDMHVGKHPNGFELSFLLSPGMSGCPIFTVDDEILIGVGVGSYKSETIEDQIIEVQDNGEKYVEQKVRIEQYGFAHDIRELLDWKAGLFAGKTLFEVAKLD